jgi:hypothetical protein
VPAEGWDGAIPHLAARDVTLFAASSAPLDKLLAYRERMGWRFDWVLTNDGDFGKDFGTSFVAGQPDPQYNFHPLEGDFTGDLPGMSSFVLDDGQVFHTYSSYARGMEAYCTTYQLLDHAPRGGTRTACLRHRRGCTVTTSTAPRLADRLRTTGTMRASRPSGARSDQPPAMPACASESAAFRFFAPPASISATDFLTAPASVASTVSDFARS